MLKFQGDDKSKLIGFRFHRYMTNDEPAEKLDFCSSSKSKGISKKVQLLRRIRYVEAHLILFKSWANSRRGLLKNFLTEGIYKMRKNSSFFLMSLTFFTGFLPFIRVFFSRYDVENEAIFNFERMAASVPHTALGKVFDVEILLLKLARV